MKIDIDLVRIVVLALLAFLAIAIPLAILGRVFRGGTLFEKFLKLLGAIVLLRWMGGSLKCVILVIIAILVAAIYLSKNPSGPSCGTPRLQGYQYGPPP